MSDHDSVSPSDDALLDLSATSCLAGGLSASTIRRRVRENAFPPPIVLARDRHGKPQRLAWRRGDVLGWCRAQIAAAEAERDRSLVRCKPGVGK